MSVIWLPEHSACKYSTEKLPEELIWCNFRPLKSRWYISVFHRITYGSNLKTSDHFKKWDTGLDLDWITKTHYNAKNGLFPAVFLRLKHLFPSVLKWAQQILDSPEWASQFPNLKMRVKREHQIKSVVLASCKPFSSPSIGTCLTVSLIRNNSCSITFICI